MRQLHGLVMLACLLSVSAGCNHVRTLCSVRRLPDTNAFVMDYYLDYHIDEIRHEGMDVNNIEDTCMAALFPNFLLPVIRPFKRSHMPDRIRTVEAQGQYCSTVGLRSDDGTVYFGRNYDYFNDACLILRVYDKRGVASLAVIDLAGLNMNRPDLDQTNLIERIPLLFAPYYALDGINRHGVAVSIMSVKNARPPENPEKPDIINSTLMRLILDYARNVDEAIDLIREFNVHFVAAPQHVMIGDSSGKFRIIEYIDGKLCITAAKEPWQICTNHIVWNKSETENDDSCWRYRIGSGKAEILGGEIDDSDLHNITRSMSVSGTMWTSLYNLTTLDACIIYRSALDSEYHDKISTR